LPPFMPPGGGYDIPAFARSMTAPAFASLVSTGAPAGLPSLGGVTVHMARAELVGHLSVPQSWVAAAQVANPAGAAFPGGGWTSVASAAGAPEAVPAGMPGMPGMPMVGMAGHHFGSGPRYGFRPTIIPRPPAAG
jgi:PPE-repeat protein